MPGWVKNVHLQIDTVPLFKWRYLLDKKYRWHHWNQLSKFRSCNYVNLRWPLKSINSINLVVFSRIFIWKMFGKFAQTISKTSMAEFSFSKVPCFQHILQNTCRGAYKVCKLFFKNHLNLDIWLTSR